MILVDTNVFVDIWTADPQWGDWSATALATAADEDDVAINPVIYAELSFGFTEEAEIERVLNAAGVRRLPLPFRAAWLAARAFAVYRQRGGTRSTPLPDFLIGAHAAAAGLPLLTRDATRIRTYFPYVQLIAP